jgi:hypothetical protein
MDVYFYRYALGGYDGSAMVPSVEIFDPRLESWITGEPMKNPRGYAAVGVVNESIYVIGGIQVCQNIVDTVSYILLWFFLVHNFFFFFFLSHQFELLIFLCIVMTD